MSEPNGTESRLDRIERILEINAGDSAARQQEWEARHRGWEARHREVMAELEIQRANIESLHANVHELFESSQRHEGAIAQLIQAATRDGENIAALARIAEAHQRRLEDLEGDQ